MKFVADRCGGPERSSVENTMVRPSVIKSTGGKPFTLSTSRFESEPETKDCNLAEGDHFDLDVEIADKEFASIHSLCVSVLMEEAPYMEEKKVLFFNTWGKVNLGEQLMESYIMFAKNRRNLPKTWLGMTGRQFR